MKYSLIAGKLPHGLSMTKTGNDVRLYGVTHLDVEEFNPPEFITESFLGAVDEHEEVSFAIDVNSNESELIGIDLIDGNFPWGMEFIDNAVTGRVAELLDKNASYYSEAESPKWDTPEGELAVIGEHDYLDIPLVFHDGNSVSCVEGYLPWGLEIEDNRIVGVTAELVGVSDAYVNTNGPVWRTQAGMIGIFDEHDPVVIETMATPRVEGGKVNIHLVSGFLPYGLELTPSSGEMIGVISGTIDELRSVVAQYGPFNYPVIHTNALPLMTVGSPVDIQLTSTVYGGKSFGFEIENLPWGLTASPTGRIMGVPTEAGIHNITVTVRDGDYLTTTKHYKVTVQ